MSKVPAGAGVEWFKCGWYLFRGNAMSWMFISVVMFLLAVASGFVPVIGGIAFMLAMPVLLAGIYLMATGEAPVEVGGLFAVFRDAQRRTPLMMLGLVMFGLSLVLSLTLGMAVFGSYASLIVPGVEPDPTQISKILFSPVNLMMLLVMSVLQLIIGFGFFFAVGLVTFRGDPPIAAFINGARAAVANLIPLSVFGAIYMLAAIVAAIPLMLGFLVLMPVTLLAGYCAYRDVLAANLVA